MFKPKIVFHWAYLKVSKIKGEEAHHLFELDKEIKLENVTP
jgi:hypothetical protein